MDAYYGNISGSLGATYQLSEGFLLRTNLASAYRAPNMAELTQDGEHGTRYEQSNATIYGSEITVEALPFKSLSFKSGYSFTRAQQENGKNLPFIPQNKLKTNITYKQKSKKIISEWFVSAGADYAFRHYFPSDSETSTSEYLVYSTSAGANIPISDKTIKLNVVANNIFNNAYYDHLSTLKSLNYYNMGRNINLNLQLVF